MSTGWKQQVSHTDRYRPEGLFLHGCILVVMVAVVVVRGGAYFCSDFITHLCSVDFYFSFEYMWIAVYLQLMNTA